MNRIVLTIVSCLFVISCSNNESAITASSTSTATDAIAAPVVPPIQNIIQHIVDDMSSKLAIGSLSYGTDFCVNNSNDNKCKSAKGKSLEKLQDDCSQIGTNFYFTIGTTSIWGGCNVPVIYQLISYSKSNYNYYDYDVNVLVKFSNDTISKSLLQQMHLFATNYTISSNGESNRNTAQFVGKTIKYKIKLADPVYYSNYDYSVIPDVQ